jgi:hypothetical protein
MDQQPKNDIDFLEPSVLLDDTQYQEGYKTGYNDGLVSRKEEARAGGGGPMWRSPSPCLGGSCGGSAIASAAVGIHSWFFFNQGQYCLFAAPLTLLSGKS